MNIIEELISSVDYVLDTRRKRRITGGTMLSLSLLFGGPAATILTLKDGDIL